MRKLLPLWILLAAAACRPTENLVPSNLNIRLSFTPEKVSANTGTAVAVIDVDNFSNTAIRLEDVRVSTSAGADKVGAILANGKNRFTAQLNGLTDASLSPVKVTVNIGKIRQTANLEIVAGNASNLVLKTSTEMVSADAGEVDLTVKILDAHNNVASGAITLSTTAGVVSQLYQEADGTYKAKLTGLIHTADSPVKISAVAGNSKAEASMQILAGVLDHFNVGQVGSTQVAGEFFPVDIWAQDKNNNMVTGFENFAYVQTSRNTSDIESEAFPGNSFTRNFVLGQITGERFRVKTAAPAPGLTLHVRDAAGHSGDSNSFVVLPASANQLLISNQPGFNLIFSADGCTKPTVSSPLCAADHRLMTRMEIKLRRYVNSPDDSDAVASLLGGRGNDILVSMHDASGKVYGQTESPTEPFLGPVEDQQNGYYYVNVYNLRKQADSPFTITAKYVSLSAEVDVNTVPGDLDHFSFPPIPAQRMSNAGDPTGLISAFFVSLTARDQWENQVFAFQDTVAVFQSIGANMRQIGNSSSMILGATFPFLMTIPTDPGLPGSLKLIAVHGSGVTGASNPFIAVDSVHTTSDFVVLLPGQYDAPPPTLANCNFFAPTNPCASNTPDLGETSSAAAAADQVVGQPFQILILARTRGVPLPVINFAGTVLLSGNNTGIEVVDNSCAYAGSADLTNPNPLTPAFTPNLFVGTGGAQTESGCYVWVRATSANPSANIISDNNRSSSIPIQGNVSSNFRVKSAPAASFRIRNIPTPQLATANPDGGKATFTIQVQAYDALGNATDNVSSCSVRFTDTRNILRVGSGPFAFDNTGKIEITDAWFEASVSQNNPIDDSIQFDCGTTASQVTSNVFQIINQGAVGFDILLGATTVKAHYPLFITATACGSMAGSSCGSVASGFNYRVTMTDTTGTIFPRVTNSFQNGVLVAQQVIIDKAGSGARICLQGAGAYKCSAPITVEIGQLSNFQFNMTGFPNVITVGDSYPVKISPIDAGGNYMPDYTGTLYLNNNYGTAVFTQSLNGNYHAADVTTGTGSDHIPKLYYASGGLLEIQVLEMNSADFLTIGDNRGHSGFSLPHTYRVVYGPVTSVEINQSATGPCVDPADKVTVVHRSAYFNFCAIARDSYGNIKKDFNTSTAEIFSSPSYLPAPSMVTFSAGVAHEGFYFAADATGGDKTAEIHLKIGSVYYPPISDHSETVLTKAPIAFNVTTTTSLPAIIKTNVAFALHLEVRDAGSNALDFDFGNALLITDTTNSIQPLCGAGQKVGTCGTTRPDGSVLTGDFILGTRDQWLSIPTENFETYIYVTDGFGHKLQFGPVNIEGNLDHFLIRPLPSILAEDNPYSLVVTAVDVDGNIMTKFNAPIQLKNEFGSINPDLSVNPRVLPPSFVNGVLNTTVTVYQPKASSDHLTVTYNTKTGTSNNFTVETRKLAKIVWDPISSPQPGYVDFNATLRTYDQFNNQYLYSGKVDFSASGGYAVRPTQSTNFTNGVLTQKIAIDGAPGNNVVLSATGKDGATTVVGASSPITVNASTVNNFFVSLAPNTSFKTGCTYPLNVIARNSSNATVLDFSGKVTLRWINGTFLGNDGLSPAISANFVNGQATISVLMSQQPDDVVVFGQTLVSTWGINAFIAGTGIQGSTSNQFDLLPAGACN